MLFFIGLLQTSDHPTHHHVTSNGKNWYSLGLAAVSLIIRNKPPIERFPWQIKTERDFVHCSQIAQFPDFESRIGCTLAIALWGLAASNGRNVPRTSSVTHEFAGRNASAKRRLYTQIRFRVQQQHHCFSNGVIWKETNVPIASPIDELDPLMSLRTKQF